MLRRALTAVSRKIKKFTMAEATAQVDVKADIQASGEKRPLDSEVTDASDGGAVKKTKFENAPPMQGRADRKRKVALLIAYCGAGYYGIQIQKNGNFRTIESEMIKALVAADLVPQEHADTPQKMSLQRAARTDKNVSAVGNVLSLKINTVSEKINNQLPPEIRVIACLRTTRGFDSKNHCTARTYKYMLPTYSFSPVEMFITKDYRSTEGVLQKVNEVLAKYVGTHNFHNFTSGRKPNDPSSKRYIMSFECGEAFVRDGIEFVVLTVKGQSFMLHHIRKMIGLMIAVVRGYCGDEVLTKSWGPYKVDIPKAPGVGLFLDQLFFAGYNKKFGQDGMHEPLVWDKYQESLEQFKEEHVLSHIARSELEESVMLKWLSTLQYHKFDVIDPNQDMPADGENEKNRNWWKTKSLLRKLDKEKQEDAAATETDVPVTSSGAPDATDPDTTDNRDEKMSDQPTTTVTEEQSTCDSVSQEGSHSVSTPNVQAEPAKKPAADAASQEESCSNSEQKDKVESAAKESTA